MGRPEEEYENQHEYENVQRQSSNFDLETHSSSSAGAVDDIEQILLDPQAIK